MKEKLRTFVSAAILLAAVESVPAQSIHIMNAASFNATDTVSPGVKAPPLYVSPGQVNAIIAPSTPSGIGAAVLVSATGAFTRNTFTAGLVAFSTATDNLPTYLEIIVPGPDVTATHAVSIGGVPVTVQGYGPAPGFSLASDGVMGQINAVPANEECDDGSDDHSDYDCAPNKPVISSLQPSSGAAGGTLTLNITGSNLSSATAVLFIDPLAFQGGEDVDGHQLVGATDPGISVSSIVSTPGSIVAQVQIAPDHPPSQRLVRVVTANGVSSLSLTAADMFTTN